MSRFSLILGFSILAFLIAGSEGVTLKLAGLRPDLEYLRGYWLKNPRESYRQGRIIFSNSREIVVRFGISPRHRERCPSNLNLAADQDHWTTDALLLKSVHHLTSNTTTLSFSSLFYKHGLFYIRENRCDTPQVVDEDDFDIEIPSLRIDNDESKSIQIVYTDLKTLGVDIEREISKLDHEPKRLLKVMRKKTAERRHDEGLFVNSADSEFLVEYDRGSRYVDIPHVRVLETCPDRLDGYSQELVHGVPISLIRAIPEPPPPETHVSFLVSTDYSLIRYDRVTGMFITSASEVLEDRWFVRSFVANYVLKDGVRFRNIPARSRISYSQVARSTVRTLAPIVKAGALGLMHAMNGPLPVFLQV